MSYDNEALKLLQPIKKEKITVPVSMVHSTLMMDNEKSYTDKSLNQLLSGLVKRHKDTLTTIKGLTSKLKKDLERWKEFKDLNGSTNYEDVVLSVCISSSDYKKLYSVTQELCQTSERIHSNIMSEDSGIISKNVKTDIDRLKSIGYQCKDVPSRYSGYVISKGSYTDMFVKDKTFEELGYNNSSISTWLNHLEKHTNYIKKNPGEALCHSVWDAAMKIVSDIDNIDKDDTNAQNEIKIKANQLSRVYLYFEILVILYTDIYRDLFMTTIDMLSDIPDEEIEDDDIDDDMEKDELEE